MTNPPGPQWGWRSLGATFGRVVENWGLSPTVTTSSWNGQLEDQIFGLEKTQFWGSDRKTACKHLREL